tara:strand:+ start:414 stop:797 length:384 start_codon:yes stop_codon:yes gene_type:complete
MATLQSLFNLTGTVTGQSDSVSISVNPVLTITEPSLTTGGITTAASTNQQVIAAADADCYLYVRNTGTSGGGTGSGTVDIVTVSSGQTFGNLKVGDFAFMPIKTGTGVKLKYATAVTNLEYAIFTRP